MKAEFLLSAAEYEQFPPTKFPEVAFAGRSNVGKSSMINKLIERKNLVKTGNTPGKTRLVNFFSVEDKLIFTDLPGYGYAAVSKAERTAWGKLIERYFTKRRQLSACVILLDIRREPNADDIDMIKSMINAKIPAIPVLTKADKLSNNDKLNQTRIISSMIGVSMDDIILFSSVTGEGREECWEKIRELTSLQGII